jgi:pimeloyl-ACP methyl ester carboxylesterase
VLLLLFDALVERESDGSYTNLQEVYNAVACVDRPKPPSLEDVEQAAGRAAQQSPVFGAAIVWSGLICAYWPVPTVPFPAPVGPTPPVLVIGTTNDPATPIEGAHALAGQLGARLLTYRGEGHTAYGHGDACVDRVTDAYLLTEKLPAADTTC